MNLLGRYISVICYLIVVLIALNTINTYGDSEHNIENDTSEEFCHSCNIFHFLPTEWYDKGWKNITLKEISVATRNFLHFISSKFDFLLNKSHQDYSGGNLRYEQWIKPKGSDGILEHMSRSNVGSNKISNILTAFNKYKFPSKGDSGLSDIDSPLNILLHPEVEQTESSNIFEVLQGYLTKASNDFSNIMDKKLTLFKALEFPDGTVENLDAMSTVSNANTIQINKSDYRESPFLMKHVDLWFLLDLEKTVVTTRLHLERSPDAVGNESLFLNGNNLDLEYVKFNDVELPFVAGQHCTDSFRECHESCLKMISRDMNKGAKDAALKCSSLTVYQTKKGIFIPDSLVPSEIGVKFTIETKVVVSPINNLSLSGLYATGNILCTQNEPEGFRNFAYILDRPDVLSTYKVVLTGDKYKYPILLSNGELIDSGDIIGQTEDQNTVHIDNYHYATFYDEIPKSPYLFAIAAGRLFDLSGTYTTKSGRAIKLSLYSPREQTSDLEWALFSLISVMEWEERHYTQVYKHSNYKIVCVDNFGPRAMENTGLNIFHCEALLANPLYSTDQDFADVFRIVGHEYLHNFTGNTVTIKSIFELTVKEGLTVFRDQCFTEELLLGSSQRIQDVLVLHKTQFPEDAGTLAHPIRPTSALSSQKLYSPTVYRKGAEVVRMLRLILGNEIFIKGMNLYAARFSGHAVTCDDFIGVMEEVSNSNLKQFKRWYSEIGTPEVTVENSCWDEVQMKYIITLSQSLPSKGMYELREPLVIPVAIGLISKQHKRQLFEEGTRVLVLDDFVKTFEFIGIHEEPVLSILKKFSAPVKVFWREGHDACEVKDSLGSSDLEGISAGKTMQRPLLELSVLAMYEDDEYSRWNALRFMAIQQIIMRATKGGENTHIPDVIIHTYWSVITSINEDNFMITAYLLEPPSLEELLLSTTEKIPLRNLMESILVYKKELSDRLRPLFEGIYVMSTLTEDDGSTARMHLRKLRNMALMYLTIADSVRDSMLAYAHYRHSTAYTDKYAALQILVNSRSIYREEALKDALIQAEKAPHYPSLLSRWFSLQAGSFHTGCKDIIRLANHPKYDHINENHIKALILTFSRNAVGFNSDDGCGYILVTSEILRVDKFNPKLAANISRGFLIYEHIYDKERQLLIYQQLVRLMSHDLSSTTKEIVSPMLDTISSLLKI